MVLLKLKDNVSKNFWHLAYNNLKSYQDQNASNIKSHYKVFFKGSTSFALQWIQSKVKSKLETVTLAEGHSFC